jgi:hypothetical protein
MYRTASSTIRSEYCKDKVMMQIGGGRQGQYHRWLAMRNRHFRTSFEQTFPKLCKSTPLHLSSGDLESQKTQRMAHLPRLLVPLVIRPKRRSHASLGNPRRSQRIPQRLRAPPCARNHAQSRPPATDLHARLLILPWRNLLPPHRQLQQLEYVNQPSPKWSITISHLLHRMRVRPHQRMRRRGSQVPNRRFLAPSSNDHLSRRRHRPHLQQRPIPRATL